MKNIHGQGRGLTLIYQEFKQIYHTITKIIAQFNNSITDAMQHHVGKY